MRDQYIVIVGCGRLGSTLANQLSKNGNSVVVIDLFDAKLNNLSPDFSGFRIEGDATEIQTLKDAQLHKATVLIASTHEDNVNLYVAQVAHKIFHVPLVLARVFDPTREEAYSLLGINTICPTRIAATCFLEKIDKFQAVES